MLKNLKMDKKHINLVLILFLTFQLVNLEQNGSNSSLDLEDLRNIFSPQNKSVIFITNDYAKNVSVTLERIKSSNVTSVCFSLKGSQYRKDMHDVNTLDLSILQEVRSLQKLWILSDINSETFDQFYLNFNPANKTTKINLKQLHLNFQFYNHGTSNRNLTLLLHHTQSLEVLNLKGILALDSFDNVKILLANVNLSSLYAINLANIQHMQKCLTFLNITDLFVPLQMEKLEYVDLSENNIDTIVGSIAGTWTKLRIVDLSSNKLVSSYNVWTGIELIVLHPHIEVVILNNQDNSAFSYPPNEELTIETLIPAHHYTGNVDAPNGSSYVLGRAAKSSHQTTFFFILQKLDNCMNAYNVTVNQLPHINKSVFCKILYCLAAENDRIISSLRQTPCSVLPSFDELMSYMDFSGKCAYYIRWPISPKLKEIQANSLSAKKLWYSEDYNKNRYNLCFQNNELQSISMANSAGFSNAAKYGNILLRYFTISNIDHIRSLDFSGNLIHMETFNTVMTSAKNLSSYIVAYNYLNFGINDTVYEFFPWLEQLDISFCNLTTGTIPYQLFKNSSFIRHVNLAGNHLNKFKLQMADMQNLLTLNLSANGISTLDMETINSLKELQTPGTPVLNIDLRGNTLSCGCSKEEKSMLYIIQNGRKFGLNFVESYKYSCFIDNSTYQLLVDIDLYQHNLQCLFPNLVLVLSVTLSNAVVIIIILITFLVYKYRYRIKTNYLRFKRKLTTKDVQPPKAGFKYDGFVSYCAEDRFWVHNTLVKELEDKYGFELCIHYRDFLGGAIVNEIERAINESRVVIIILSQNSLQSNWCKYELQTAHYKSIEEGTKLLVVKLGNIKSTSDMEPFTRRLLDSEVYIAWPDEDNRNRQILEDQKSLFWAKITNVLYGQDVADGCCCWGRLGYRQIHSASMLDRDGDAESGVQNNQGGEHLQQSNDNESDEVVLDLQ